MAFLSASIAHHHHLDDAHSLVMSSLIIAGAKDNGGVRPIAISESFYKLSTMYAISLIADKRPGIFEPIQFGVGATRGGNSWVPMHGKITVAARPESHVFPARTSSQPGKPSLPGELQHTEF